MSIFTEDLQASAKVRTLAPVSQFTFTADVLTTMANEEMHLKLVKDVMSVREDFFLTSKDVTLSVGLDRYAIPKRAIANSFKSLWYVEGGILQYQIHRAQDDELAGFVGSTGKPVKFHIEGDEVVLLPTPSADASTIRFRYHAKPNLLTATSDCAKITAISSAAGTTTLDVDTDLTASLSVGSQIDFVSTNSPYLLWAESVAITAISSTQIQVATSDISNAAGVVEPVVGDYLSPTGYANIPMLPYEFFSVLAQMVAVRILASLGHTDKWNAAKIELKELRSEAMDLIRNRVIDEPRRIVHRRGLVNAFRS